jgi:hypothetical protein
MPDPVKVLVLYDHPLLGEGLGTLMASVPELEVERVAMGEPDAMERAIAAGADVVILEEGGPVGLVDLLRDGRCRAIVDVCMNTSQAWTIRREAIASDPDSLIDRIISACLGDRRSTEVLVAGAPAAPAPPTDPATSSVGQATLAIVPAVG